MNNFKYKTYIRNDVVKASEFVTNPVPFNGNYPTMSYSEEMKDITGLCGIRCIDYVLKYFGKDISFKNVFDSCSKVESTLGNSALKNGIGEQTIMNVTDNLGDLETKEIQIENIEELKEIFSFKDSLLIANVTELDNETKEFGSHWVVIVDIEKETNKLLVADSSYRKEKSGGLLKYSFEDFFKIFRDLEEGKYNNDETEVLAPSTWYFGYGIIVSKKK